VGHDFDSSESALHRAADIFILYLTPMKRVIISEDIWTILEKEQSFLSRSDIKMFAASSNEKALALHRAEKADLLIAKLDSPEMSGETLSSLIRSEKDLSSVSLIMVCADTESDVKRCLRCNANAFITGPVDAVALLQEAYQLLNVAPRRSCRIPVGMKIQGTSKKVPFTAYAENISVSGMMFRTAAIFFEGDTITCSFSLPDSARITANGEVVRVVETKAKPDNRHYGVKFIDLSTESYSAIEEFVGRECVKA
jgi:DNA-binding response OmpR family regulator